MNEMSRLFTFLYYRYLYIRCQQTYWDKFFRQKNTRKPLHLLFDPEYLVAFYRFVVDPIILPQKIKKTPREYAILYADE